MSPVPSPSVVMRLLAGCAAIGLIALLIASPAVIVRLTGGDPLHPDTHARLDFLRLVLGILATGTVAFCLSRKTAVDWQPLRQFVFTVPFAALAVVALYKLQFGVRDPYYLRFIREDGLVEYATAAVFLAGGLVAASATLLARDLQARVALLLLSCGLTFIALSEISFGQRLLGLETPESLLAINRQKEISVHNIYGIEFVVYGILPHVLLVYALFSGVAARALGRHSLGRHLSQDLLAVASVPWYAVGYFLPMAVYSAKKLVIENDTWQDQEPSELFLAFGFLLVALHARTVLNRQAEPRPAIQSQTRLTPARKRSRSAQG